MFVSVICQKIDNRKCLMIAEKGKEKFELELELPFFKTKKKILKAVRKVKKDFHKNGFPVTGAQISSAITIEYPEIPHAYY